MLCYTNENLPLSIKQSFKLKAFLFHYGTLKRQFEQLDRNTPYKTLPPLDHKKKSTTKTSFYTAINLI